MSTRRGMGGCPAHHLQHFPRRRRHQHFFITIVVVVVSVAAWMRKEFMLGHGHDLSYDNCCCFYFSIHILYPYISQRRNVLGNTIRGPRDFSRAEGDNAFLLEAVYGHSLSNSWELLILWCEMALASSRLNQVLAKNSLICDCKLFINIIGLLGGYSICIFSSKLLVLLILF